MWAHMALSSSGVDVGNVKLKSYCIAQLELSGWEQFPTNLLTLLASLEQRQRLPRD